LSEKHITATNNVNKTLPADEYIKPQLPTMRFEILDIPMQAPNSKQKIITPKAKTYIQMKAVYSFKKKKEKRNMLEKICVLF